MTKDLLVCLSSECVGFTLRLVGGQWCGELPGHWHVMDKDLNACLVRALQKVRGSRGVWTEPQYVLGVDRYVSYYFVDGLGEGTVTSKGWTDWRAGFDGPSFASEAEAMAWVEAQVHGE